MKLFRTIAIGNTITRCTLIICVTVAAIYFENWKMLFLYLIALLFTGTYTTTHENDE